MFRQIDYAFDVAIHDFVKRSGPVKFVRALSCSIRHLTRTSQKEPYRSNRYNFAVYSSGGRDLKIFASVNRVRAFT